MITLKFAHNRQGGFTLIELLVVIAIIGVLSSVVLASLNSARGKSANAAVKANLSSLRREAEMYYDTVGNGSYGSVGINISINCPAASSNAGFIFNDPGAQKVRTMIVATQAAANNISSNVRCSSLPTAGGATSYVVSSPLNVAEGSNNFWCVDSSGNSRGHPTIFTGGAICP